jgi:hypothetical protein
MKTKDKEFIREILSSDFNHISNPDFTRDTVEMIVESEENKVSFSSTGDISFLIPWILYASLFILLSFVTLIISWPQIGQENIITHTIELISGFLLNPVTISILISFSILYIIDLYLKRVRA